MGFDAPHAPPSGEPRSIRTRRAFPVLPLLFLTAFTFSLAFAPPAAAKGFTDVPSHFIRWTEDWNEALALAKARNVPILVAFHRDG